MIGNAAVQSIWIASAVALGAILRKRFLADPLVSNTKTANDVESDHVTSGNSTIPALEAQIKKLSALVKQERKGRTEAERKLRNLKQVEQQDSGYSFTPIGKCRSIFANRRGTPRQGVCAPDSIGWIELEARIPDGSLQDLELYSHIWILFVFHENTNMHKAGQSKSFPAKVKPPLLGGKRTGLFATRTPHRPNNIGLSLVKLEKVALRSNKNDFTRVYVSGLDLIDQTPVLDFKPFVPGDCIAFPEPSNLKLPSWVPRGAAAVLAEEMSPSEEGKGSAVVKQASGGSNFGVLNVEMTDTAREQLVLGFKRRNLQQKRNWFFTTPTQAIQVVSQVLSLDIRSVHQGRGGSALAFDRIEQSSGNYEATIGNLHLLMDINDNEGVVIVKDIQFSE